MGWLIDRAGVLSALAQKLPVPITSMERLCAPQQMHEQRLYVAADQSCRPRGGPSVILGILKVGTKKLFVTRDGDGRMSEIEPCCVLDFYVHESCQRSGWGSRLFNHFLEAEQRRPARLAYDRPSHKFIAFLAKHHGLKNYTPQNNNYVVFWDYWNPGQRGLSARRLSAARAEKGSEQRREDGAADSRWSSVSQRPLSGARSRRLAPRRGRGGGGEMDAAEAVGKGGGAPGMGGRRPPKQFDHQLPPPRRHDTDARPENPSTPPQERHGGGDGASGDYYRQRCRPLPPPQQHHQSPAAHGRRAAMGGRRTPSEDEPYRGEGVEAGSDEYARQSQSHQQGWRRESGGRVHGGEYGQRGGQHQQRPLSHQQQYAYEYRQHQPQGGGYGRRGWSGDGQKHRCEVYPQQQQQQQQRAYEQQVYAQQSYPQPHGRYHQNEHLQQAQYQQAQYQQTQYQQQSQSQGHHSNLQPYEHQQQLHGQHAVAGGFGSKVVRYGRRAM